MKRSHFAEAGYALTAVLLIVAAYAATYYSAVKRHVQLPTPPDLHGVYRPDDDVVPSYRFGDATFFYPAHEIDRRLRPKFWSWDDAIAEP